MPPREYCRHVLLKRRLGSCFLGKIYRQILNGALSVNEGMLFENAIAQCLAASGYPLFFFTRYKWPMHSLVVWRELDRRFERVGAIDVFDDALSRAVKHVSKLGLDVPPVLPETISACAADVRARRKVFGD